MAQLNVQHVDKIYDNKVQAVFDFNLDVKDGELIVLVGPSGCGKSTTLRMIAGLEDISAGHLFLDGKDITQTPAKDRDMAMVFQSYALYGHMTIYENMAFSLTLRKENPNVIHKKVLAAAEILGLTSQLNKKPSQLSGGQRQRVAMGRSIVRNPKVFLFDEPLSNLDAKLRGATRREILLLHKRLKATMLYVTHDQTEALTLADRIVCMSMGHVQQVGTPLELYVKLTEEEKGILRGYAGKEITLGVRPENVEEGGDIAMKVFSNENLGMNTLVHGHIGGGEKISGKFRGWCNYKAGDDAMVSFGRKHFFDKETGNAIRKGENA